MYRVTGDDWDEWEEIIGHFDVSRDFARANMIGAPGLNGKSWPDLDMLPLGTLSSPDSNLGPHRKCNLSPDEQKTQVTLWSIARSPLMFGGDMRSLDNFTHSLITNPTILEINDFSSGNAEFPHVDSNTVTEETAVKRKGTSPKGKKEIKKWIFSLTNCIEPQAKSWYLDGQNQICYNSTLARSNRQIPFCLYRKSSQLNMVDKKVFQEKYKGLHHLSTEGNNKFCFQASPVKRITSKEKKRGSFSTCGMDANQLWEFKNGILENSYSHMCAAMTEKTGNTEEVRAWVASGRNGETYAAFFNLNKRRTRISMDLSRLGEVLPRKNGAKSKCECREVWSGKDLGVVEKTLVYLVEMHGTALFELKC